MPMWSIQNVLVYWNAIDIGVVGAGKVLVAEYPEEGVRREYTFCSHVTSPIFRKGEEMSQQDLRIYVMGLAMDLVRNYKLDPEEVHRAFLEITEYCEALDVYDPSG